MIYKTLKEISVYSIGNILVKGLGFASVVLYSNFLTKHQMGVYGYINAVTGLLASLMLLGIDNAYARYFFEYKSKENRKILTATTIFFLLLWSNGIAIFFCFFSKQFSLILFQNTKYYLVLILAFISLPIKLILNICNQVLRNQFKAKTVVALDFFFSFTVLTLTFIFLKFYNLKIEAIFVSIIISGFLILPFEFYSIKDLITFNIDLTIIKKMIIFGAPFFPTSLAYWIFSSADRIMLKNMKGLESVGIYTVALSLASVVNILSYAISQAWSPNAINIFETDPHKASVYYGKFLDFLLFLIFIILFFVSAFGREILLLFFSGYQQSFYPMLILVTGAGFQITTQITAIGISLKKKTMYFAYLTFFIALLNIGLNYIFIPFLSEKGAALATTISYGLLTLIYYLISKKMFKIKYNPKSIILFICGLLIVYLISKMDFYIRLIVFLGINFFIFLNRKKYIRWFVL